VLHLLAASSAAACSLCSPAAAAMTPAGRLLAALLAASLLTACPAIPEPYEPPAFWLPKASCLLTRAAAGRSCSGLR